MATIRSVDIHLTHQASLICSSLDLRLLINGVEVGRFMITPGATTTTGTYSFAAITGPTYTFRIENVRAVPTGCGSTTLLPPMASGTLALRY